MIICNVKSEILCDWIENSRDQIEALLWSDGYILFRDFDVGGIEGFERAAELLCKSLYKHYGDLPLAPVSERIYFATAYPNHLEIQPHNEASHTHTFPSKQLFYCLGTAKEGGEWTLTDGRSVLTLLPDEIAEKFREEGVLYQRRFIHGLDVTWKDFFQVATLQELADKIRPLGYKLYASSDDDVTVTYRAKAIFDFPQRKIASWFNQILLHHPDALPVEIDHLLSNLFDRDKYPRNVYFGSGNPIPTDWMAIINSTLRKCLVTIPPRLDDILLVNNLLVAHGRMPYSGNRQIRVALGDMIENRAI